MRRFLTIMVVIMTAAGLVACGTQYLWHQKLTVAVETPEGIKTGSAVVNEKVTYGRQPLSGNGVAYGLVGEAAVVELPGGRYLFALHSDLKTLALAATLWRNENREDANVVYSRIENARDSRVVPPKLYPILVTFTDLSDPKSVKLVDPANLAATFGQGYLLKSITLEITDEDVTKGRIEKLLPWLGQYPEPPLCKPTSETDYSFCAASVHHGDFIRR